MTHGSLFAGIGGFDLGFERAGFETVWQVEIDEYCRRVLERHFPRAERFSDIQECGAHNLKPVDVITGGFPCQPFSSAARGAIQGTSDPRFLWPEMRRVVAERRPRFVVVENVPNSGRTIFGKVVPDLESEGYDIGALDIPACAFGHDHKRSRLWILGYTNRYCKSGLPVDAEASRVPGNRSESSRMGTAHGLSGGLDARRLAGCGNAVVPQIAQWIAERIKAVSA